MSSEIYTIAQIKLMLSPVFQEYDVKKAVLFGSYGKGIATSKSDIDLLVESRLKGLRFVGLLEAVQSTLDKEVDLLDVSHIEENSKIDEEIRRTGVVIYEK